MCFVIVILYMNDSVVKGACNSLYYVIIRVTKVKIACKVLQFVVHSFFCLIRLLFMSTKVANTKNFYNTLANFFLYITKKC